MAKIVLYITACILIVISVVVLSGIIVAHFMFAGKTPEQLVTIMGIHPRFPKLIYYGAISGFISSIIFLVSGINLVRLRNWARTLLLWFIPPMILLDLVYFYLMDMLNIHNGRTLIFDLIIWMLLLNKNIEKEFRKTNKAERARSL